MPIEKADIVEVVIRGESNGQAVLNVLHYRQSEATPADSSCTPLALLTQFWDDFNAWVTPLTPSTYRVNEMAAFVIDGRETNPNWPSPGNPNVLPYRLTYKEQAVFVGTKIEGTRTGQTLTTFTAFGVRHISDRRGRPYRGSARWLIGVEADTEGNRWTSPDAFVVEAMAAYPATFEVVTVPATPSSISMTLCVFGRTTYLKAPNSPTPVLRNYSAHVVNSIANPYVTSQVSRKQRIRLQ